LSTLKSNYAVSNGIVHAVYAQSGKHDKIDDRPSSDEQQSHFQIQIATFLKDIGANTSNNLLGLCSAVLLQKSVCRCQYISFRGSLTAGTALSLDWPMIAFRSDIIDSLQAFQAINKFTF